LFRKLKGREKPNSKSVNSIRTDNKNTTGVSSWDRSHDAGFKKGGQLRKKRRERVEKEKNRRRGKKGSSSSRCSFKL